MNEAAAWRVVVRGIAGVHVTVGRASLSHYSGLAFADGRRRGWHLRQDRPRYDRQAPLVLALLHLVWTFSAQAHAHGDHAYNRPDSAEQRAPSGGMLTAREGTC
jgi:hypothetical protein